MSLPNKKDELETYRQNLIRENKKELMDYFIQRVNAENPHYTLEEYKEWLSLQTVMDLEYILQ